MSRSLQNAMLTNDHEDSVHYDYWMLLVGKTGVGKSATGNTIFNESVFCSEMSSLSVTKTCQKHTGSVNNRKVTVIDTPDFIYSTNRDDDSNSELNRAFSSTSGFHAILFFLTLNIFTVQEKDFVGWFKQIFGIEALRYTIVIFTHADMTHLSSVDSLIRRNNELFNFVDQCGGKYHVINNKDPANRRQVTELMEKTDRMVFINRNTCFTLEMLLETERRAEEKRRTEKESAEREQQMELERIRSETENRVKNSRNRVSYPVIDQIRKKHICVFVVCAVTVGHVLMWEKGSLNRWIFMKSFFTGGSTATLGIFIGVFWRLFVKSQFMRICSSSQESQCTGKILNMTVSVMFSAVAGAVIGHFVEENVLPITVLTALAGAAGALTSIL